MYIVCIRTSESYLNGTRGQSLKIGRLLISAFAKRRWDRNVLFLYSVTTTASTEMHENIQVLADFGFQLINL